jgi:hypothetical protein
VCSDLFAENGLEMKICFKRNHIVACMANIASQLATLICTSSQASMQAVHLPKFSCTI